MSTKRRAKKEPKARQLCIRMDESMLERVRKDAQAMGVSDSDAVRIRLNEAWEFQRIGAKQSGR